MRKNILFPIESYYREIDYKLILAAMAVDEESDIYLGQHDIIFKTSQFMKGGIYLGKNSMRRTQEGNWTSERHIELKENDFTVIHLDEEGAVFYGLEKEWVNKLTNLRVDLSVMDEDDYICTWGEFQKNTYEESSKIPKTNIFNTGHPRFNLPNDKYSIFYEDEVIEKKSKYGDFILVCTNFGLFNNAFGTKDSFSGRFGYENITELWGFVGKTFVEFIELISTINLNYPNQTIVIRPHPSEDMSIYNDIFSKIDNVHLVKEGTVGPWLIASNLMIHDGCTTGIEAFLANTPVINFHPFHNDQTNLYLPNTLGMKCQSQNEVMETINAILNHQETKALDPKDNSLALSLLKNLDGKNDSFEEVLKVIGLLNSKIEDSQFSELSFRIFLFRESLNKFLKNIIRPLFPKKAARHKVFQDHFPGFRKNDLEEKIKNLSKIVNKKIKYKIMDSNLIKISLFK